MNLLKTTALALTAAGFAGSASAVDILVEDFETDGNGTRYTTSVSEFSDGGFDYFTRTDGTNISPANEYLGATGSFFAAQDIDAATVSGAQNSQATRQTLTFSGIDISNFTNLTLSLDAAEDDDGTNQDWDLADLVHASFVVDGVAPTSFETGYAIWFDNDGSDFNSAPFLNFDFDGDGGDSPEDTEVTSTFTSYERALGFSGSTADLVITFDLDSGDEDFAIDNIRLTGDVVPEPASLALIGLGAVTLLGRRRSA